MLNRRSVSRYHLVSPLTGYIEHGEIRYLGEITELSTAGFRLRLRNTAKEAFISPRSTHDFGEIIHGQDELGGFGEIRYVRPDGKDLWIGFKWDDIHATDNIQKCFGVISDLVAQGVAGSVNHNQGVVELVGHVSSVLAEDVEQGLVRDFPRLCLRECSSIDSSGLSLLAQLEDTKVRLENMSLEIAALLHHYRLQIAQGLSFDPARMAA